MKRRCSDRRLERLVRKALLAIEDPARGIVFDDFDIRYREKERKREMDAAHWFYRDKTSFETKYAADCGNDPCNEPAWVTDGGRGKAALEAVVSYDLDGEDIGGPPTSRGRRPGARTVRISTRSSFLLKTVGTSATRRDFSLASARSRSPMRRGSATGRSSSTGSRSS